MSNHHLKSSEQSTEHTAGHTPSDSTNLLAKHSTEAHHNLALEAFAPPKKHEAKNDKHTVQDKHHEQEKDQDLATFKARASGCHRVVMHYADGQNKEAPKSDKHGAHAPAPEADVEVRADGALKWHSRPRAKEDKTLVVAFTGEGKPGAAHEHLTEKQTARLKQLVDVLEDSHAQTRVEVDKQLQEKARIHVIPTDKQDKAPRHVIEHATRHGERDSTNGHWSGGNGSLYRRGQSRTLTEPPATVRDHLGTRDKEESDFLQNVAPTDRPQIKDFVDKLVWAISGNEGNYTTLNPNDAGHGISIGIRQWNQKSGELPTLLRSWHDKDPEKFNAIFGQYSQSMLNESFIRGTNFASKPGLLDDIRRALADKEFQQVQLDLARQFVVHSVQLGYQAGFRSELALADIADVINQCGPGGFQRALRHGIKNAGSEKNSVLSMEHVLRRPNGMQRLSALAKALSPATAAQLG
ncbi:MAG: hypothetical protein JST01_04340 [Cyanobacteria bacterium SZAS TMP-1]|nr:hypothetical protein [Cyanobacteria bacterium SZAS TMP-1]